MFIVDAHEDIAWNALALGRDYSRSALEIRAEEAARDVPPNNGRATLGLPQWLAGRIGIICATIFVEPARNGSADMDPHTYRTQAEAHVMAQLQLDYYHRFADEHAQVRLVHNQRDLQAVAASWQQPEPDAHCVGFVLLMEGADPIREPREAEYWAEQGVRIIAPAWSSTRYAGGTGQPGPLTRAGVALLDVMADQQLMLDISHLSDEGVAQALDIYPGVLLASHTNPRAIAALQYPERALSDTHIVRLAERDGVIGVVPYNRFLKSAWTVADGKAVVPVGRVAEAADYISQLTGSCTHVGIGSDFDGGFGADSIPDPLDTVADLAQVGPALRALGYSAADAKNVLQGNWLRLLQRGLPA
ncbi:MAG: hypothetical protein RL635_1436 [Chloroflexota bacterium]